MDDHVAANLVSETKVSVARSGNPYADRWQGASLIDNGNRRMRWFSSGMLVSGPSGDIQVGLICANRTSHPSSCLQGRSARQSNQQ